MRNLSLRLAHLAGIDTAVSIVLLSRAWGIAGGITTLWLITKSLSLEEQGTYYTFSNIINLQIFLELGLGYVVMQTASHEMANIARGGDGTLTGDPKAKGRLAILLRKTVKIYSAIGIAFLLIITPTGHIFFHIKAPSFIAWAAPWTTLCIAASFALTLNALLSFTEGCGRIIEVSKQRLIFGIAGNIITWIILISGGKLYAAIGSYTATSIVSASWLWFSERRWLKDLWRLQEPTSTLKWREEIWPFQWRIAVSWLGGFLIFQLFNPIVYATCGADAAGRFGLTMQIGNILSSIASSWMTTKLPHWGNLSAQKKWAEMDKNFKSALIQSSITLAILYVTALTIIAYNPTATKPFLSRLLPFPLIVATFGAFYTQHLVSSIALFIRANKTEPLLWHTLISGLIIATGIYPAAHLWGTTGCTVLWFTLQTTITLPWAASIFFRFKKKRALDS